ncbi:nuclear transport factor 2 family protein [Hwangdonia lutea]|uniref:Nuclear transport factor 2 family protein n=1 Tax=Hwangdonia lutea TaxID=3075823 RepID=A0AA97EJ75_9FLAO|nr:nuclear transport factor 2 family protein [Hwangdonia sp. SCSIO 19198]WOD42434.1 nuclear transport factor 2 family protein [Hwangdonia sp. SCSIO 19198]
MKLNLVIFLIFSLSVYSQTHTDSLHKNQPESIVQKHIEPFNNRNLDDFVKAFDSRILVSRFPNDTMYLGRDKLKENYARFFQKNKKSHVKVLKRMVINNIVIDEELATVNHATNRHVTIYNTGKEGIKSMTFVNNSKTTSNPEAIVNKQLEAYNKRDIDAFVNTYSTDIKLYKFPNSLMSEGQDALKKQYESMFEKTPDLNAEIVNRMVLGNKVIDKEKVTANGNIFYAIAIYEVKNGKINKVTFIQ